MENEEKKEVKNHQSYSSMHPKKVSSPLCSKPKGEQQDELCLTVNESLHSAACESLQSCDPASSQ